MKKIRNRKTIIATLLCGVVLAGVIYYVNFVYVPAQKAVASETKSASEKSDQHQYTVKEPGKSVPSADTSASQTNSTSASGSDVTVTKKGSDVYVKRTWGDKTSTPAATAKVAASKPAVSTTVPKKSSVTTVKPKTVQSTSVKKPSSSSSTPKNGDERVVNGQKEVYLDGFGWGADTSGGKNTYIDNELTGEYVGEMG